MQANQNTVSNAIISLLKNYLKLEKKFDILFFCLIFIVVVIIFKQNNH